MRAQFAAIAALTFATVACGAAPSRELVNARQAYDRATHAHAAEYTPASVLSARQALQRAEREYADDAGSDREKSYAYVAQRRAELAVVHGNTAYEQGEKLRAELEYDRLQEEMGVRTQARLEATEGEIERQTVKTATARSETERERQARLEAEGRAQRAMDSLQQIAQVKEEARGMVITLSGQVLFVSGKAELVPPGQFVLKLGQPAVRNLRRDHPLLCWSGRDRSLRCDGPR
jgi:flagellar motor protein MotB